MEKENRYKLLYVPSTLIFMFIRGINKNATNLLIPDFSNILPEDAEVVAVQEDFSRLSFVFKVFSKSFENTPIGEKYPILYAVQEITYKLLKVEKIE